MAKVVIVGSGAFGSALSIVFSDTDNEVWLYGRDRDIIQEIKRKRRNFEYLPGASFNRSIVATNNLQKALSDVDIIILAVPAEAYKEVLNKITPHIQPNKKLVVITTAKGFVKEGLLFEIVENTFEKAGIQIDVAVLSGPNFAGDIARGLPMATTIASRDLKVSYNIACLLGSENFRFYPSDDLIGVYYCGGLKNIYVIGGGVVEARGQGASVASFYIVRILAEMRRLIKHFGGQEKTVLTLAGVGDIVMCCQNMASRNMAFGYNMARWGVVMAGQLGGGRLVEGFNSLINAYTLFEDLDCPIIHGIHQLACEKKTVEAVVEELLFRDIRID